MDASGATRIALSESRVSAERDFSLQVQVHPFT
jgi:hypothetical protein